MIFRGYHVHGTIARYSCIIFFMAPVARSLLQSVYTVISRLQVMGKEFHINLKGYVLGRGVDMVGRASVALALDVVFLRAVAP